MTTTGPRPLRQHAPAARILLRAALLVHAGRGALPRIAAELDEALASQPITIVPALDRAFRDPNLHAALGLRFLDLRPSALARLVDEGAATTGVLGVASLVRDGHTREAAARLLADRRGRIAAAFLINRLNDYVVQIGDLAWAGLERRLVERDAESVVRCLPLVERMGVWVRSTAERRRRLSELVRAPAMRPVLLDSLRDRDRELARAACSVLLELYRGQPEIGDVLAAALQRGDQALRRQAAVLAVKPAITPLPVLQALAPQLAADRDPAIRAAGVQAWAAQGDRDGLLRAAFDPRGLVRHHARLHLAARRADIDYRTRALATLADPGAPRPALVGALATLSDFGRRPDLPAVAAFLADPSPSIAREAARTHALLSKLPL